MSGGSYNYICYDWRIDDGMRIPSEVEAMAERLDGLGYADDAAAATRDFIKQFDDARAALLSAHERLSGVWKAVEWFDSNDWSEDSVHEALEDFRKRSE